MHWSIDPVSSVHLNTDLPESTPRSRIKANSAVWPELFPIIVSSFSLLFQRHGGFNLYQYYLRRPNTH